MISGVFEIMHGSYHVELVSKSVDECVNKSVNTLILVNNSCNEL